MRLVYLLSVQPVDDLSFKFQGKIEAMCILFSLFRVVMTVTRILLNAASSAEFVCVKMCARTIVVL